VLILSIPRQESIPAFQTGNRSNISFINALHSLEDFGIAKDRRPAIDIRIIYRKERKK